MATKYAETPLIKQYTQIKEKHPDAILLFRVGDFYETFGEDAVTASEILGITLTRRANGAAQHVELAGFPHHALDTYLPKLVRAGRRVAVCDQLEDPKKTKKLVKRGITELVTPGVVMSDNVLSHNENNYLAALYALAPHGYGLAFLDISTGEFLAGGGNAAYVDKLLANYKPKELLTEKTQRAELQQHFRPTAAIFDADEWMFSADNNRSRLTKQFGVQSLKGFGIEGELPTIIAAGAILNYLDLTSHTDLGHISGIHRLDENEFVRIDPFTAYSLEIIRPIHEGGGSLLSVLDRTLTPMGARLLRKWLLAPLREPERILKRQRLVQELVDHRRNAEYLHHSLAEVGDPERLAAKIAVGRVSPRELVRLALSLRTCSEIAEHLTAAADSVPHLAELATGIIPTEKLADKISRTLEPEAPIAIGRGKAVRAGVSPELDELRNLALHGKEVLSRILRDEQERTGIPSLKISFNNVFGYFLEVRNTHKEKVPPEWIRKQTLVNAERYITEELKQYEEKILGAEQRIEALETEIFAELVSEARKYVTDLQFNSNLIARLDVLHSFAEAAGLYRYTAPTIHEKLSLEIRAGRHPVIERRLPPEEPYIPNDVTLDDKEHQIAVITGPNMSGKSALLRQTALITLMAQCGSFVPAAAASIGVVDAIFTRVGASDNITAGESTFMIEMQEASGILNSLTPRSLVLFDELGRGTSTYDGISIAWAIIEYLHNTSGMRAKTLFATHYHELGELESLLERVCNYNVSAREVDGKMLFLRTLVPGCAEHSFGIQVARLAGMPRSIIDRANEILHALEDERHPEVSGAVCTGKTRGAGKNGQSYQMSLFQLDDPLLGDIRTRLLDVDINRLTPLDALGKLDEIQRLLRGH